ncbi:hypothetical protein BTN92_15925 [Enterococcus mundtii]|uniref:Glucose uptake protein n=1 Tax=Enterococcus mundtii TaxID=53346 RepID=A0A1V2U9V0_ENTMU|nr:hypothetical protein BTN92_15925 [Enterococcus mundtii]
MINLSMFLFLIPFFIFIFVFLFFHNWKKYDTIVLLSSLPSIFFILKIVYPSLLDPIYLFNFYLIGLIITSIFYIIVLFIIYRRK